MAFFDESGIIYSLVTAANNWTGSTFLTMLIIVLVLFAVLLAFGLPLELSAPILLPLILHLMAYDAMFKPVGALFLLYIAFIIGKNWPLLR